MDFSKKKKKGHYFLSETLFKLVAMIIDNQDNVGFDSSDERVSLAYIPHIAWLGH